MAEDRSVWHLAKSLVKEGQRGERGDVVALVGSTTWKPVHLHYMVKKNGQALDPTKFILISLSAPRL